MIVAHTTVDVNNMTLTFTGGYICEKDLICYDIFHMIDTKEFKEKLEAEKALLVEELAGLGVMNPANKDWEAVPPPVNEGEDSDENDMADRAEGYEERSATLGTLESRLKDVDAALEKIASGKYGICESSGEEIEIERLRANPAARTKIQFAEK